MNQKQIIAENKAKKTAVFFNGEKRIMTYGNINYTQTCIELERLMHKEGTTITMLLFDFGDLPAVESSWERKDYEQYVKKFEMCKECLGYGLVNEDGFCKTCAFRRREMGEEQKTRCRG